MREQTVSHRKAALAPDCCAARQSHPVNEPRRRRRATVFAHAAAWCRGYVSKGDGHLSIRSVPGVAQGSHPASIAVQGSERQQELESVRG